LQFHDSLTETNLVLNGGLATVAGPGNYLLKHGMYSFASA